jgi:hypothetical protein
MPQIGSSHVVNALRELRPAVEAIDAAAKVAADSVPTPAPADVPAIIEPDGQGTVVGASIPLGPADPGLQSS